MGKVVEYERRAAIAIVTLDHPPVNALNQAIRQGLLDAVARAGADAGIRAVLLAGRGRLFSAGADIGEFGDATRPPPYLSEVICAFDASDKPIVAAIQGAALGGALELAMACHYRVSEPGAKLGLSEVKFGIIPGAGGTQLLPRLIGPAVALDMIMEGKSVDGREAARLGLIDLVIEDDLLAGALAFTGEMADRRPLPRASQRRERLTFTPGLFEGAESRLGGHSAGASAPRLAISAVRAAVDLPFERGLERERELWAQAAASPESAAMRYLFRAERSAAKPDGASIRASALPVGRVAVIGTGTMGTGIAIALADAAIDVTIVGRRQDRIDAVMQNIRQHYTRAVEKRRVSPSEMEGRLGRVAATVRWDRLDGADLVIETIVEDAQRKREVLARVEAECRPDMLLGTNTSSLDLSALATAIRRPEGLLGLHFFSPAHSTKLLEIVQGERTELRAIEAGIMLAKQLGKVAVVTRAGTGIASTRMFVRYLREANLLLLEGALPQEVDLAMTRFGMAMGPLAASDLAGLDVGRLIRRGETQPPAEAHLADAVPDRLVDVGRLGQKTGLGYHRYTPGSRSPQRDPDVEELVVAISQHMGFTRRSFDEAEIVERCLSAMVNESADLLDQRLVNQASDIDVIWVDAYGFPRHRGGPIYHAGRGAVTPAA